MSFNRYKNISVITTNPNITESPSLLQQHEKQISLKNIVSLLFGLWIFLITVRNSPLFIMIYGSQLQKFFELLMMLGLFYLFFYKRFFKKQIIPLLIFSALVVLNFFRVGNDYADLLPLAFLIIFQEDRTDLNRLLKSAILGYICSISLILIFFMMGLLPDNIQVRLDVVRHSLGFNLPIHLPAAVFSMTSAIIFYFRNTVNTYLLLALSIPMFIVNEFSDGRTYLLVFICIFIAVFLKKFINNIKYSNFLFFVAIVNYIGGVFFSLYSAYNFWNSTALLKLNEILTGRVWWWAKYIENYSIKLFPQTIIRGNEDGTMWILDNAYLTLILENGLLIFISFTILLFLNLRKLRKENDCISLILWNAWFLTFISGNNGLMVSKNVLLLQIGSFLWMNKNKLSKSSEKLRR